MWWYTRVRPGLPASEKVAHLLVALGRSPSRRVLLLDSDKADSGAIIDTLIEARAAMGRRAKGELARVAATEVATADPTAALWVIEGVHTLDAASQEALETRLDATGVPAVLTGKAVPEDALRSACRWTASPRAPAGEPTPPPNPDNLPVLFKTQRAELSGAVGQWLVQQANPELTVHLHHLLRKKAPVCDRAAAVLAQLPPQLLREKLLIQLVQSLDPAQGALAATLMGGLDDETSLEVLERALGRRDLGLRGAVAAALAQRGATTATRGLRQPEAKVRKRTALALCRWPAATLPVDELTDALPHLDKEARTVVRRVLGRSEVSDEDDLPPEPPETSDEEEDEDDLPPLALGLDDDDDDDWEELDTEVDDYEDDELDEDDD